MIASYPITDSHIFTYQMRYLCSAKRSDYNLSVISHIFIINEWTIPDDFQNFNGLNSTKK